MNHTRLVGAIVAVLTLTGAGVASAGSPPTTHAGEAHGLVKPHERITDLSGPWWRGARGTAGGGRSKSVNMSYHGGPIMADSTVKAIFWGPSWANTSFAGDKITGLDLLYGSWSGSNFAKTNTEYTDGSGARVGATSSYAGHIIDTSKASGGGSTSAILNEVAKQVTNGNIALRSDGNTYVAVYTDIKRGTAGYCAWHSVGTIGGTRVQFAFFWNLDGDSGCDPLDNQTGHSQGLAALANVSAHELSEAVTDPALNAWYDTQGYENSDKCAWTFNVPFVTLAPGSEWKLQGNWSNAAYTAGTGYPNRSGQKGCLDGR